MINSKTFLELYLFLITILLFYVEFIVICAVEIGFEPTCN